MTTNINFLLRYCQPVKTLLTFLLVPVLLSAQVFVPYRVGDKFGIADLSGKLTVPATYDFIEAKGAPQYFVGYKFQSSTNVSSVIFNNKEIIKDREFRDYSYDHDLFVANEYILSGKRKSGKNFEHKSRLFDVTGKDVLNRTYSEIYIVDHIDEKSKLGEALVVTTDPDNRKSILIYDKKQHNISKTIVDQAIELEAPEMFNSLEYHNKSIVYAYRDAAGYWYKVRFEGDGNTIKAETEKLSTDWKNQENGYIDSNVPMPTIEDNRKREVKKQEGARLIKIDRDYYYMPKKLEKVAITYDGFSKGNTEIFKSGEKQGLRHLDNRKIIIPANYDEIIEAEFSSKGGGHIMRNVDKYGLYLYENRKPVTLEPVFTKIPILVKESYFGTNQHLIKLYDDNGNFFCYANMSGKMFYRAK